LGWLVQDTLTLISHPLDAPSDHDVSYHPGAATAQAAIAAANQGAPVRFIGQIGADPSGAAIRDRLAAAGVELRLIAKGDTQTAVSLVTPSGQREQIAGIAAVNITPADLDEADFADLGLLHLTGYDLLTPLFAPTALAALAYARSHGALISFDATSLDEATRVSPTDQPLLDVLAPDLIFTNYDSVAALFPRAEIVPVADAASPGVYLASLSRPPDPPDRSPV
jgi:sugar/nucleoside kinase (ribokinase family)